MAGGQAKGSVNDWQNVEPSDWQTVPASGAPQHQFTADEVSGGPFMQQVEQEAFGPQMAPPNEGLGHHIMRGIGNFGGAAAGAIPEMLMHPVKTAQSAFELSPAGMAYDAVKGKTPQAMTDLSQGVREHPEETLESTAGNIVGGIDAGGMAPGVTDLIPTRGKAGQLFQSVMNDVGDRPVNLTRTMAPLERAQQLSARGHGNIALADNLYKRINTVNPLDYREARDWASGASRLSGQDKMSASPTLRSNFKQMSHALNEDIGDTASSAGRGEDYAKAMRDYRRAAAMADTASAVGNVAKRAAIPVALGAGGYKLYHALEK